MKYICIFKKKNPKLKTGKIQYKQLTDAHTG